MVFKKYDLCKGSISQICRSDWNARKTTSLCGSRVWKSWDPRACFQTVDRCLGRCRLIIERFFACFLQQAGFFVSPRHKNKVKQIEILNGVYTARFLFTTLKVMGSLYFRYLFPSFFSPTKGEYRTSRNPLILKGFAPLASQPIAGTDHFDWKLTTLRSNTTKTGPKNSPMNYTQAECLKTDWKDDIISK